MHCWQKMLWFASSTVGAIFVSTVLTGTATSWTTARTYLRRLRLHHRLRPPRPLPLLLPRPLRRQPHPLRPRPPRPLCPPLPIARLCNRSPRVDQFRSTVLVGQKIHFIKLTKPIAAWRNQPAWLEQTLFSLSLFPFLVPDLMLAHVPGKCNFADNFTKEQKCNATFTASRDTYMCSLADGGCWKVSNPIPNAE